MCTDLVGPKRKVQKTSIGMELVYYNSFFLLTLLHYPADIFLLAHKISGFLSEFLYLIVNDLTSQKLARLMDSMKT